MRTSVVYKLMEVDISPVSVRKL